MSNPLESIWNLLFGPGEAEKYQENPAEYLAETGLDEYEPAELHDLVVMAYEKGPVYQGASVNVGGNQAVGNTSYAAAAPAAPAYSCAAAPAAARSDAAAGGSVGADGELLRHQLDHDERR